MNVHRLLACIILPGIAAFSIVHAQTTVPPDSAELVAGTRKVDMQVAERAGYPSPATLLKFKDAIGLTREQVRMVESVQKGLGVSVQVKGEEIIEAEQELAQLFETGTLNEKTLRSKLERIGKLRAELRFAGLQVYLKMKQILTPNQRDKVKELSAGEAK